jgi:hypothetical protein
MTNTMKIYDIQFHLDNPSLARIRFPTWLKCLYNIFQMEIPALDPLGAFYLIALDEDYDIRPENLNPNNQVRPRPLFSQPPCTPPTHQPPRSLPTTSKRLSLSTNNAFVRTSTRPFLAASAPLHTLQSINFKHRFGTGALSPLDLVRELKAMFGTITKHEIDATQAAISAPLVLYANFRDFCS